MFVLNVVLWLGAALLTGVPRAEETTRYSGVRGVPAKVRLTLSPHFDVSRSCRQDNDSLTGRLRTGSATGLSDDGVDFLATDCPNDFVCLDVDNDKVRCMLECGRGPVASRSKVSLNGFEELAGGDSSHASQSTPSNCSSQA